MQLLNLHLLLDQAAGGGSPYSGLIMILAMVVVFYFFIIRPQSKRQKTIKRQREALTKGDKVVTAGGIHGRIKEVEETAFLIEVASGVCLKVDKNSVYPLGGEMPDKR
jgi:preprotein translocase subunit YajC